MKQLLDTTEFFSLSRGLLMDPRASSLTAFVMGVEGNGAGDEWRMITLNFKRLLQRKCEGEGKRERGLEFSLRISCSLSLQAYHQTISSGWSTSRKIPVSLATETPTTLPNLRPCKLSSVSCSSCLISFPPVAITNRDTSTSRFLTSVVIAPLMT